MNWLNKTLLTASSLFILNQASSQILNYTARVSFLKIKMAEINYNIDRRFLSINISKFAKINFTYYMPDDSTYVETNKNGDFSERYTYSKKDSSWVLINYESIKGKSRPDKANLEKIKFENNILTPIQTLEKLLKNNISDTSKVFIFGVPYSITTHEKDSSSNTPNYIGNISHHQQNEKNKFILEDEMKISSEKKDYLYIPQSLDAKVKILQKSSINVRVNLSGTKK